MTNGNCEATSTTLISVEGNIGCGKSSMLAYLKQFRTVEVYPEPVEKWQNTGGANLLTQLYQDPKRWAYLFHSYVYVTATDILQQPLGNQKVNELISSLSNYHIHALVSAARRWHQFFRIRFCLLNFQRVKIIERSIDSNRFCFVELSRKLGNLAASEHLALDGLWQVAAKSAPTVDLIVYLRTDPEVSHARMAKRCRSEEDQVPLQYLQVSQWELLIISNIIQLSRNKW